MRLSLMVIAVAQLSQPVDPAGEFVLGSGARLVRYEYVDKAGTFRVTEIMNLEAVRKQQSISVTLVSLGETRLVRLLKIDRQGGRCVEILVGTKGERAEFRQGTDVGVSEVEWNEGVGILKINGTSLKLSWKEDEWGVLRQRLGTMVADWGADDLKALEMAYRGTRGCGLRLGRGVIIPALVGDRGDCKAGLRDTTPDSRRDREFVEVVPELASWLRRPARLLTNTPSVPER